MLTEDYIRLYEMSGAIHAERTVLHRAELQCKAVAGGVVGLKEGPAVVLLDKENKIKVGRHCLC